MFDCGGGSGRVGNDAGRCRLVRVHYWLILLLVYSGTRDTIWGVRCLLCGGRLVNGRGSGRFGVAGWRWLGRVGRPIRLVVHCGFRDIWRVRLRLVWWRPLACGRKLVDSGGGRRVSDAGRCRLVRMHGLIRLSVHGRA